MLRIGSIGFGEAAQAFSGGWLAAGASVSAFDVKTRAPDTRSAKQAEYAEQGVTGVDSLHEAVVDRDLAFSLVTADQALVAAQQASEGDLGGTLWLDCNSCAPGTKREASAAIARASGRYVDVAVMAPVHPKRHAVPLLLSGPDAETAAGMLSMLGMRPSVVGDDIGQASTIKMLRSVMIKGTEALFAECFLAARKAGVLEQVVGSLDGSNPEVRWEVQGCYNLERMLVHGGRRAAEMREVVKTLADLELPNALSEATVQWQAQLGQLQLDPGEDELVARLSRVIEAL